MNVIEISNKIHDLYAPKIIGEVNDVYIKLVKIKGDKVPWHHHKNEDELFYILKGRLLFEIENKSSFFMNQGDLFIVKRGVNHRVSAEEVCTVLLVENKTTLHTGNTIAEISKSINNQRK